MLKNILKIAGIILLAIVAVVIVTGLFISAYNWQVSSQAAMIENRVQLTMYARDNEATAAPPTATPAPTATLAPTATPIPATATKVPTIAPTTVPADPYAWTTSSTVKYENETAMAGGKTFKGPGVCEWWDNDGYDFVAEYNPKTANVTTTVLHEGYLFLNKNQAYTFPKNYTGKCWSITEDGIAKLVDTNRHTVFYTNPLGNSDPIIVKLKEEGKIWSGMVVDGKLHGYMAKWLAKYGLGKCDFFDQSGCAVLIQVIVQPPLGSKIETMK